MSAPIVAVDHDTIKDDLSELVRRTVEETLNALLSEEADDLIGAERYERTAERGGHRAGHHDRTLTTASGNVTLHMPKLKGIRFATAIIDRYKRREASVEEAIIETCLAGVSTGRIEGVSEALWDASVSASTASSLNERAFEPIEERRDRPLAGALPYVYIDGICLKRSRDGAYENVAVMAAIGVNDDGRRETTGAAEGSIESADCRREFLSWLKGRGLKGAHGHRRQGSRDDRRGLGGLPRRGSSKTRGPFLQERDVQGPQIQEEDGRCDTEGRPFPGVFRIIPRGGRSGHQRSRGG